ncbi:hypothetical protein QA640_47080 (plasmid) [Bradyrhizobium sp. CB82]|uniref:hypothetical protein n=1 Tax=Bradyrhizobium sp. CB82 TaxID=3039159 RepID=UPI0024B10056|nr:hypothetical protein [Bradyrhizobium sp. CB82]WFU45569.1 hypothetical protein QA640_47080 [Bradyrhizobium sp. CB82]
MTSAGDEHAGIASGVNNAVARIAGLLAVAALGAVLSASFSNHLSGITPTQTSDALNAVMAGHPGSSEGGLAAFDGALRTVMWTASICAGLGGCIGWLSIRRPDVARSARPL